MKFKIFTAILTVYSFQVSTSLAQEANTSLSKESLMLDLDAAHGITLEDGDKVSAWKNQVKGDKAQLFVKQDGGRDKKKLKPGSGRPRLIKSVKGIAGKPALEFLQQELVNMEEDTFDHLTTGSGYTWFAVISAHKQGKGLKDVKSFFGNLKNSAKYSGLWGCFKDDNTLWTGARNGVSFGRFDENNTQLLGPKFEKGRFYIVASRMEAGRGKVKQELFVNSAKPIATATFPVSKDANPSKMAVGQERDAVQHPGKESYRGQMARLLIYDKPLTDAELAKTLSYLSEKYGLALEK